HAHRLRRPSRGAARRRYHPLRALGRATGMSTVTDADAAQIKALTYGLGFDLVGLTTLGPAVTAPHLHRWLAAGRHGEMSYMADGATLREDTTLPEPGMRSAIVVGLDYGGREPRG